MSRIIAADVDNTGHCIYILVRVCRDICTCLAHICMSITRSIPTSVYACGRALAPSRYLGVDIGMTRCMYRVFHLCISVSLDI